MRSFSRSSWILLMGGASAASFTSLTSTFFSPVAASTYHSSPCSPESSRWMKENLVLSGLHLIVSGPRPVMPPSAKIASIVSGSFPARSGSGDWAIAQEISTVKTTVRGTNRFMRKLQGTRLAISRVEKCTPSGRMMQKACSRCRAKSPRSHAKITIVPSE